MDPVLIHSYWTVLLLVVFVAIIIWAFSSKRRKTFETLASMPLEEDQIDSVQDKFHG